MVFKLPSFLKLCLRQGQGALGNEDCDLYHGDSLLVRISLVPVILQCFFARNVLCGDHRLLIRITSSTVGVGKKN